MEQGHDNRDHREYEDLLAGAALGVLNPDERAVLMAHLKRCPSCRSTLAGLFAAAGVLPGMVEERAPSGDLRERLRAQAERDASEQGPSFPDALPEPQPPVWSQPEVAPRPVQPAPRRRTIPFPATWLVAAAVLILGLLGGVVLDRLAFEEGEPSPPAESLALSYPTGLDLSQAHLTWFPGQDMLHFSAPDMPKPPQGHVYQVWLIAGDTPEPAGVVDSATGQYATMVDPGRYGAFAITVEPAPLGSPGPTSKPIIVAAISGNTSA